MLSDTRIFFTEIICVNSFKNTSQEKFEANLNTVLFNMFANKYLNLYNFLIKNILVIYLFQNLSQGNNIKG